MKGTGTFKIGVITLAALGLSSAAFCRPQSEEATSLGTIARELKAKRAHEKQKPVKVYTNDSIRELPAPQTGTPPAEPAKVGKPAEEKSAAEAAAHPPEKYGEQYFRSRADKIRSRLKLHRGQLAVLEQQLSLASTEYYPDPQKTLQQESTPDFHGKLNKLRAEIGKTKQQISADQKAMDDLQQELRRHNGDPGWLR